MLCKNCGTNCPDEAKFCAVCGSKLENGSVVLPTQPPVDTMTSAFGWGKAQDLDQNEAAEFVPGWESSEPTTVLNEAQNLPRCPRCGNVIYGGSCTTCGWNAGESKPAAPYGYNAPGSFAGRPDVGAPMYHTGAKKGKSAGKIIGLIAGIAAVALVLAVLLIGISTNWFGATGPAVTIASAVKNTLSESNVTVDFSLSAMDEVIEGTAQVDIDMEKREIMLLLDMEYESEHATIAIYDGYAVLHIEDYWAYVDISDELDEYFDAYEQTGEAELDWDEFLDGVADGMYDELSDYVDFDTLNECIRDYVKNLNNKRWLQENAGYTTKKENGATVHSFRPDLYQFTVASVSMLEPAIRHASDYETLMENLEYEEELLDEIDLEFAVAVKGGKMVGLDVAMEIDGDAVAVELDFSNIGKTELNRSVLADMLETAIRNS